MKARVALEDDGCSMNFSSINSVADIGVSLQEAQHSAKEVAIAARSAYEKAQAVMKSLDQAQNDWARTIENLGAPLLPTSDALTVDQFADCHTRFHLFRLACHYWEGRWLLEMEENLDEITGALRKTGLKTVEPR